MLIDYSHPQLLPQDIPFAAIETVTIGDNSAKEPVLSLSIASPDGTRNTIGLVFSQPPRTKRIGERDAWAAKLKEMSMAAQQEHGIKPAELVPPWVPGELPAPEGKDKDKTGTSENVYRPLISPQKRGRNNGSPKKTRMIAASAVIVVIIVAVALGSYFLAPSLWKGVNVPSVPTPTPVPTPVETAVPTPTPEPVETPVPTTVATPVPTIAEPVTITPTATPQLSIPQTGVWVHVKYDGKYTGTAGTSGGLRDIIGSGEGYTQIPVKQGIIMATIQKLDNSGEQLTVDFYKDGALLKSGTTRAPKGTVDIQAELPAVPW